MKYFQLFNERNILLYFIYTKKKSISFHFSFNHSKYWKMSSHWNRRSLKLEDLSRRWVTTRDLGTNADKAALDQLDVPVSNKFDDALSSMNSLSTIVLRRRRTDWFGNNSFRKLAEQMTNVVDFRANCFNLRGPEEVYQFIEKNPKLEVLWLITLGIHRFMSYQRLEEVADKRSSAAPKLVLLLKFADSISYIDAKDVNMDILTDVFTEESVGKFLISCRNATENAVDLLLSFVPKQSSN